MKAACMMNSLNIPGLEVKDHDSGGFEIEYETLEKSNKEKKLIGQEILRL